MIKIINLKKVYSNNLLALDSISLNVNFGDFFAILGKNGAGKSTLIGILTSLIKKTSGKIFIFDYDFDFDNLLIKKIIGYVPQEYNFNQFEIVIDVILDQAGFYGISRIDALNLANFYLKLFNLWEKRNTVVMNLSGGMKRRLMIIKALIHNPKILILDEPTTGVDIFSKKIIYDFLLDFNKKGNTIILTTHNLEEVEKLCNKVIILDLGSIILDINVSDMLIKLKKKKLFLNVENNFLDDFLVVKDFKLIVLNKNLIEITFLKNNNLNFLFDYLIKNNIIITNVFSKNVSFEELFINLVFND